LRYGGNGKDDRKRIFEKIRGVKMFKAIRYFFADKAVNSGKITPDEWEDKINKIYESWL